MYRCRTIRPSDLIAEDGLAWHDLSYSYFDLDNYITSPFHLRIPSSDITARSSTLHKAIAYHRRARQARWGLRVLCEPSFFWRPAADLYLAMTMRSPKITRD